MTNPYSSAGAEPGTAYQGVPQGYKKKRVPGWYKVLCVFIVGAVIMLFISAAKAKEEAGMYRVRKKLGAEACISTDNILGDELGWITDVGTVKKGIDYFYDKTGVQPYLLICDNLDGKGGDITDDEAEEYLQSLYSSLYRDEGHMIFVFMEYEESQYITFLYTGRSADSVIDADAREIFLENADYYYTDSSLSDEEYFEKIFRESALSIMEDPSSKAAVYAGAGILGIVIMVSGLILFNRAGKKYI
ncbi:hypothetical protein AALA00_05575 [Lachnospiraceae bacterium 46-15]